MINICLDKRVVKKRYKTLQDKYTASEEALDHAIYSLANANEKKVSKEGIDIDSAELEDYLDRYFKIKSDNTFTDKKSYERALKIFNSITKTEWNSKEKATIRYNKYVEVFGEENTVMYKTSKGTTIVRLAEPMQSPKLEMQSIKEKAIADGTFMKAPNGNTTNLTERQYAQVRTKAFKDWFGDWENNPENASKVIDENGEPLVVYHGSKDNSFTIFDSTKNDKGQKGFFFTNDRTMASSYGKNPREFFINSRNPYIIEGHNNNWNNLIVGVTDIAKDKLDSIRLFRNDLLLQLKEGKTSKETYDFWNNKYFKLYDKYLSLSNSFIDKIKKIAILNRLNKFEGKGNFLKSTRYTERVLELDNEDVNIIFKSITDYGPVFNKEASINMINNVAANVYVVTKPNNIKSATSNTGEFSRSNDDINLYEDDFFNDDTHPSQFPQVDSSLKKGKTYSIDKLEELFNAYNTDKEQRQLSEKIFKVAKRLGFKVSFLEELGFGKGGLQDGDVIKIARITTLERNKEKLPDVILHEVIHGVSSYVIDAY